MRFMAKKWYLVSIIDSSQMDWVNEGTGLNQPAASGTKLYNYINNRKEILY